MFPPDLPADVAREKMEELLSIIDRLALGHPDWVEYHAKRFTQGAEDLDKAHLFHERIRILLGPARLEVLSAGDFDAT